MGSWSKKISRLPLLGSTAAIYTITALALASCGDDHQDQLQAIKDCEIINVINERRCKKRELPDAVTFSSDRRHFQSRDVVYVGIADELLDYGNFFSVINSSTNTVLISHEKVPKQAAEFEGFSLFDDARVKVRIHPAMNPDHYLWRGVVNDLRIVSRKGRSGNFRYNVSAVHFTDYDWVGAQGIAYTDSSQEFDAGYKAELWFSEQAQPAVYGSDIAVTIGGFSALNPGF